MTFKYISFVKKLTVILTVRSFYEYIEGFKNTIKPSSSPDNTMLTDPNAYTRDICSFLHLCNEQELQLRDFLLLLLFSWKQVSEIDILN